MQDVDPSSYAPPLTWWGRTWRLVLVLLTSAIVWGQVVQRQWESHRWLFFLDLGLGLVAYVLMFFRRRWPVTIAVVTTLLNLVSGLSAGPSLLASVSLATRRVVWQVVLVGVLAVAAGEVFSLTQPSQTQDSWWVTLGFAIVFTVAMMATGMYVGSRRELLWSLRQRARQAEEQQGLRISAARAAERERIAREMHDVLAHRISMVSMHAGALAYRTDLPPDQVRETASLIQAKAHEALSDLRQVLGVLRDTDTRDGSTHERPQPAMRDLSSLVAEAQQSGMHVELDLALTEDDAVPEQVGRTVYRIVQEGLTNARKHALGGDVRVRVTGSAGPGVDVWVRNATSNTAARRTATPGAGLGLVGLRERTELAGGRIEVLRERGGFALHGWLPWQESQA